MGDRLANLHLLHIVIAEFPAVLSIFWQFSAIRALLIMFPLVLINLGRLESALTQLDSAGLCDNYVVNGDWRGGNPFFPTVLRLYFIYVKLET